MAIPAIYATLEIDNFAKQSFGLPTEFQTVNDTFGMCDIHFETTWDITAGQVLKIFVASNDMGASTTLEISSNYSDVATLFIEKIDDL